MHTSIKQLASLLIVVALLFTIDALAFTEPSTSPPGGNVPAPVNVGTATQDKAGWFTFQGGGTRGSTYLATQGGRVGVGTTNPGKKLDVDGDARASRFCLGSNCISSWPAGGSGSITDVQSFTLFVGDGGTASSKDLGVWKYCALTQYKTTEDDSDNYDNCYIDGDLDTSWTLGLTKHEEDTLTCEAICFK